MKKNDLFRIIKPIVAGALSLVFISTGIFFGPAMDALAEESDSPPPADVVNGGVIESPVYGTVLITTRKDGFIDYTFFDQGKPAVRQILKAMENGEKLDYKKLIQDSATAVTDVRTYRGDYIKDDMKYEIGGTTEKRGTYTPTSTYGSRLSTKELREIQGWVSSFLINNNTGSMTDLEKIRAAHDYLVKTTEQAPKGSKHNWDNAWGALVYHEANSKGYARGMKALLDAAGVGCYVVDANSDSVLTDYSWNVVHLGEFWYIVDAFADDGAGSRGCYLISDRTYRNMGMSWNASAVPGARYDYGKKK